jgi:hypothetical protein
MHVLFAFICRTANGFSSYNATLLILVSIPLIAIDADRYLTTSSSYSAIARCVFGFSFGALSFNLWTSGVGETLRCCSSYLIATVSEATRHHKYIESPFREWSRRIVRRGGLIPASGGFG